jgi:uncharacterized small protein (DUF1192 family)
MRHYDEDMIDFPVSDVWRDHYAAQGLTYPSGRYPDRPKPKERGYSDLDGDGWSKVGELIQSLNHKQAEIERLKAERHKPTDSRDSFEGVE